eukprot:6266837-Prymnesium_polylepis.1
MAAWRPRPRHTRHMRHVPPQPSGAAIIASGVGAGPTKTRRKQRDGAVCSTPRKECRGRPHRSV